MTKKVILTGLILLSGMTLSCTPPNASDTETPSSSSSVAPTDTVAPTDNADTSEDDNIKSSGEIAAKDLSRTQFVSAMKCALTKTEDGALQNKFNGQILFYDNEKTESRFDVLMQFGGGESYELYKEAVKLGCSG